MITASEILQAVKYGGSENWRPPCEVRAQVKAKVKDDSRLDRLMKALGDDQLTINQLAEKLSITREAVRHQLGLLMEKNMVKRSTGRQPLLFYKV
jgi:predicted ArsR family transcriptional regulator